MNTPNRENRPLRAVIWVAVSSQKQIADDKISVAYQEDLGRQWCAAQGITDVTLLAVPGYSRSDPDIFDLLQALNKDGIFAYDELRKLWKARAFDVLWAYSFDRLGRSQTLINFIVENVIASGAYIHLHEGGAVTAADFRMKATLGGYAATAQMQHMRDKTNVAKDALIKRGLPIGGFVIMSHKRVRDPDTGRDLALVLNEDLRRLWDDLAVLLLEGVAWNRLGSELYKRFGHADASGQEYSYGTLYTVLMSPMFWGHSARGYTVTPGTDKRTRRKRGAWVFDASVPPPDGVLIAYDVVPAVYTGAQAEAVKAELRRRMSLKGNARPENTYRYSGLFVCEECGRGMTSARVNGKRVGLRCFTVYTSHKTARYGTCSQTRIVQQAYLDRFVHTFLRDMLEGTNISQMQPDVLLPPSALEDIERDIQRAEAQIDTLITEQSLAPASAQPRYRARIAQLSETLATLQQRHAELRAEKAASRAEVEQRARALEDLRGLIDDWFALPDRSMNQKLKGLLGKWRFGVRDRVVTRLRR